VYEGTRRVFVLHMTRAAYYLTCHPIGGVRGTAFVRAPKSITFPSAGGTYDNLMHAADWLPTICDVAGVKCNTTNALDGLSHWQAFQSSSPAAVRDTVVIGNSTNMCDSDKDCGFAYRKNNWKLLRNGGGEPWTWTIYSNMTGGMTAVSCTPCLRDVYACRQVQRSLLGLLSWRCH
jgi:arylsulfatase A-like enzyme